MAFSLDSKVKDILKNPEASQLWLWVSRPR